MNPPHRFSPRRLMRALIAVLAINAAAHAEGVAPRCSDEYEAAINQLMAEMTLEDKLGQLTQQWGGEVQDVNPVDEVTQPPAILDLVRGGTVGSFLGAAGAEYTNRLQRTALEESRLKIPLLLGNDIIHGFRTIFPIPLGEAASWNPAQVEAAAAVAAAEARASGTHWTFAPMVDITVDPRWGRVAEGAGEDPHLGSIMAAARVRGFQGEDPSAPDRVLACAKHYVAYGGAEGGRDYNVVDISLRTLRERHLPPFKAAVGAGVASLMSAFNEINGVPASANVLTLDTILRAEWGFCGFVVSDWDAVEELVDHGYAADPAHAGQLAIRAGVDMDMSSLTYRTYLAHAVAIGLLEEHDVDTAVRRVLRAKFAVGLFDNPYADPAREAAIMLSAEHRSVARETARQAIVLLRNEGDLLPLDPSTRRIAVIGPLTDSQVDPMGTWKGFGRAEDVVTVLAGLHARVPDAKTIRFVKGCDVKGDRRDGFADAVKLARESDVVLMVLGESEDLSGEAHCRSRLDLPGVQRDLLQAVHATGKPVVLVLMAGRPLAIPWAAENIPAILHTWHLGTECGNAIADVLFGDFNPCGRLPITVPRNVGQVPIYYAHKRTGRPPVEDDRYTSKYIDVPWTPLYPFGFGLSYTTFAYSNLRLEKGKIHAAGQLTVHCDVKNTGRRAGHEVAQLYIHDRVASVTQPVRRLCGFERLNLEAGESKTVTFHVGPDELAIYDDQMVRRVEPGAFNLWVGSDAASGLQASFEVVTPPIR